MVEKIVTIRQLDIERNMRMAALQSAVQSLKDCVDDDSIKAVEDCLERVRAAHNVETWSTGAYADNRTYRIVDHD